MVFSDNIFLFFFLPLVILCTNLCPKAYRNYVLLVFSLIFYAWGEPVYIILMLSVIVLNYLAGLFIDSFPRKIAPGRRKAILVLAVAANLLILGYFKYTGFFAEIISSITGASLRIPEILLPIGISFYIFQSMSYVIDVYRGRAGVQKNIFFFGTYVALFPQLIAGPIVRYSDIERQLTERRETLTMFSTGIRRFIYGYSFAERRRYSLRLGGNGRLYAADLFRFFRIQRYGNRTRKDAGLQILRKLQLPVYLKEHNGVLEKMAYLPVFVV